MAHMLSPTPRNMSFNPRDKYLRQKSRFSLDEISEDVPKTGGYLAVPGFERPVLSATGSKEAKPTGS